MPLATTTSPETNNNNIYSQAMSMAAQHLNNTYGKNSKSSGGGNNGNGGNATDGSNNNDGGSNSEDYSNRINDNTQQNAYNLSQNQGYWYDKMSADGRYNQQQSESAKIEATRVANNQANQANLSSFQQQKDLLQMQENATPKFGGSSSTAYGLNAPRSSGYSVQDPYTGTLGMYDGSSVANWENTNNDILRRQVNQQSQLQDVQTNAQKDLAMQQHNNSIDMMNRQTSINAQNAGANFDYQSRLARQQQGSNEKIAGIEANSRLFGSVLSSVRTQPGDYQYWGGRV